MPSIKDQKCYSDEWTRTNPDLILNLPTEPPENREYQDHVLVDVTPGGDLLAIWTVVPKMDYSVYFSRSKDNGKTWTKPEVIDGPGPKPGQVSQFGFPVISKTGRIYCFYNKTTGFGTSGSGIILCKYSDDDGYTWIDGEVEIHYRRTKFDHPDPSVEPACIIWQKPIRDSKGRHIVGLTRTTSEFVKRPSDASHMGGHPDRPGGRPWHRWLGECRSEFLRFDNIDEGPHPKDVKITWLPDSEDLISVPVTFEPQASEGMTFCQEPGIELLPDGRLFTEMRTTNGDIWYTVSDDDGHSWRQTEVLRYKDNGDSILNPIAPTPIYRLQDGRYLLFLQNHDGFGYDGWGPRDLNSRRPQFISVGEYREGAHQPIWFSEPLLLFDTDKVGVFPNWLIWLSMYSSLTEKDGQRTLWYTDRKLFALGKHITDEMLAPLKVPS